MKVFSSDDAFTIIKERLNDAFWAQSAIDKIRVSLWDGNGYSDIAAIRVNPNWPHKGTISFVRVADGKRLKLSMNKKKWKIR